MEELAELKIFSKNIQKEILKMINPLPAGHVGGSLSICDLLAVLYGKHMKINPCAPQWEGRDWLVMSKGHCGPALYAALALKNYFPLETLATLNGPGTNLPSHCDRNRTIGIDMSTGSLGQGASTAAGVAYGHMLDGNSNFVYLILGDGEINEGQVWEMALFAGTRKLDNLITFIDHNKLQLDGRTDTDDICNLGDIQEKYNTFGWNTARVDGHNIEAIDNAIENAKNKNGKPTVIILDTLKGYGFKKIENKLSSHSCAVSNEDLCEQLARLESEINEIKLGV